MENEYSLTFHIITQLIPFIIVFLMRIYKLNQQNTVVVTDDGS